MQAAWWTFGSPSRSGEIYTTPKLIQWDFNWISMGFQWDFNGSNGIRIYLQYLRSIDSLNFRFFVQDFPWVL